MSSLHRYATLNVKTNVGKIFLKLLQRHFPSDILCTKYSTKIRLKEFFLFDNHGICYVVTQETSFESQQGIFWMQLQS